MSESWKCPKCGYINTGNVGGMSFGSSFASDMARMTEAAENAQKICASCGADRTSASQQLRETKNLQAKTTIQQPRGVVWKIFTNPKTWEKWWGGVLQKVDPNWQENGYLIWEKGSPSRIDEFVALERVMFISQSSGMKTTFTFIDTGHASTLVVYKEDYSGSTLSVANPSAKQAQCDSTVADLKRYAESAAGQAASEFSQAEASSQELETAFPMPEKPVPPSTETPAKPYVPGMGAAIIVVVLSILGPFLFCVPYLVAVPLCLFVVFKAEKRSPKIVALTGIVVSILLLIVIGVIVLLQQQ